MQWGDSEICHYSLKPQITNFHFFFFWQSCLLTQVANIIYPALKGKLRNSVPFQLVRGLIICKIASLFSVTSTCTIRSIDVQAQNRVSPRATSATTWYWLRLRVRQLGSAERCVFNGTNYRLVNLSKYR